VERAAHLSFDRMGRVGVVSGHSFLVLNDNNWLDVFEQSQDVPQLLDLVWDAERHCYYYGSLASWGRIRELPDGGIKVDMREIGSCPQWVRATNFVQILIADKGALFAGYNGVVYEDYDTGKTSFFEIPQVVRIFQFEGDYYASSQIEGLLLLNLEEQTVEQVSEIVLDEVLDMGDGRLMAYTTSSNLYQFDGERIVPMDFPPMSDLKGAVSQLLSLDGGRLAVAVDGLGLYVFSREGALLASLTTEEHRRILDVTCRESGVLWLTTETSVQKVFYDGGITIVDQRAGVMVEWPQLVNWSGITCIASRGNFYDIVPSDDGVSLECKPVEDIPESGVWGVDADEESMLVGNTLGIYERRKDGFHQVLSDVVADRLVMDGKGYCFAISNGEIALLQRTSDGWRECSDRMPGVGYPSVVHFTGSSVWIELGIDLAARVWHRNGKLHTKVYEEFVWDQPSWVNIGQIGSIVVFSGGGTSRMFFDETEERFVDAPELQEMFQQAPFNIKRMAKDVHGVLWATHEGGLLMLEPGEEQEWQSPIIGNFRDQYPILQLPGRGEVWMNTESALYQIDPDHRDQEAVSLNPILVSINDGRTGERLYTAGLEDPMLKQVPYSRNHLLLRLFAGGYTYMQGLNYAITVKDASDQYTLVSTDSLLSLPNLWEGNYELTVQALEGDRPVGESIQLNFSVAPPWYRTLVAYFVYGICLILMFLLIRWWGLRQANLQHLYLERLVKERTEDLRSTMVRLTEEARVSATLSERNRLASEIHDSVQQGLSGLMLQIDATLKLSDLHEEVRSRLGVARKMVAFTREEVQQAIWDLESPFLENSGLPDALSTIADMVTQGKLHVNLEIRGKVVELPAATQHHLLRIAQEAITNAMRHSGADRIAVQVDYRDTELFLMIEDFGSGFPVEKALATEPGHFGLRGLRARTNKINGEFRVFSEEGSGTRIEVRVPYRSTESSKNPQEQIV